MTFAIGVRSCARTVVGGLSARLVALVAAVSIAACTSMSTDTSGAAKEAAVKKRVEARWGALIKGDVAASYALLSPASKAVLTENQYREHLKHAFTGIDVESVKCEADSCKVKVWITYDATPTKGHTIKGIRTTATETWVIDKGEYWYVWPN